MTGISVIGILLVQFVVCKKFFFKQPDNKEKATLILNNRFGQNIYSEF